MTRRAFPRPLASLSALALGLVLLAGCGDDDPDTEPAAATPDASTSDTPTASDTAPASPSATETDTTVVPVYYVGDTPIGERLYREFTQSSGTDPLLAAATALAVGAPVDPDYRTLWPRGKFASIAQEADAIVVELADDTWLAPSLSRGQAKLAIQQLVYTLQGVVGERLPVRVQLGGQPVSRLLGVEVNGALKARPQLDVLAFMNVTEPAEGTVVADTFTATGRASSFEATVAWSIEDEAGTKVLEGFVTADGWMDKLYPWSAEIDASSLAPGSYTFIARTDDPSEGEGGGPTEDTKQITVE